MRLFTPSGERHYQTSVSQVPIELLENRRLLSGTVITPFDTTASPVAALSVTANQGKRFKDVVGDWTVADGAPKRGSGVTAIAIVDWGDGKTSHARFVDDGSGIVQILGTHNWAKAGTFQMTVTVEEYPKGHPHQLTTIGQGDGSAVVAPRPHAVSVKGTLTGTYTTPVGNPDARSYEFTGTGTAGALGSADLSGSITPPGFIRTGAANGELTLTAAGGTVTLDVTGHTQNGGSPLPQTLKYVVTDGTGTFANAGGRGTISIALDTAANTFVMVIH